MNEHPKELGHKSALLTLLLVAIAVGLGVLLLLPAASTGPAAMQTNVAILETSNAVSFQPTTIAEGQPVAHITNVQILDYDGDGNPDVLVCDAAHDRLTLHRRDEAGRWQQEVLADGLRVPAHATVVDVDQDGDRDVVVSILGDILPSDKIVGEVILLEREGETLRPRVLLDEVRRVADVQAGDLDGDGDIDLAVAVFGYARGEILWLENVGGGQFRDHPLLSRPGAIHVPLGDYDGDGDLDIATVVSQDEEELWALENHGGGEFEPRQLYFTHNFDVGTGGLVACDLDQDGDLDFLVPWGDNLEYGHGWPQPYHGCMWFENEGGWSFRPQRIGTFGGTYAAAPGDVDADGDLDVALISMSNDWSDPRHASVAWLENDGTQQFHIWEVDTTPAELITVACGDLNNDGRADIVAGRLHLPTSSIQDPRRVAAWLSQDARGNPRGETSAP